MNPYQTLASPILNQAGLNCQAVFDLAALPPEILKQVESACPFAQQYQQLILIGHGGTALWQALKSQSEWKDKEINRNSDQHPIDDFSTAVVKRFLKEECGDCEYTILYPSNVNIGFQTLGKLAGWHHQSPFMVGINAYFGSWFAYRVVVLANMQLPAISVISAAASDAEMRLTPAIQVAHPDSPCTSCAQRFCVRACPAQALNDGQFDLDKCLTYRQQESSLCEQSCIARVACPVGDAHRYSDAQIHYHYGRSIKMIRLWLQKRQENLTAK